VPLNGIAAMVQVMISTTYCILQFGKKYVRRLGSEAKLQLQPPTWGWIKHIFFQCADSYVDLL